MRSELPGAARSISSIASKWDRFGCAMPTACTTPKVCASQNGLSGAIAGCIPNWGESWISCPDGILMFGRSAA